MRNDAEHFRKAYALAREKGLVIARVEDLDRKHLRATGERRPITRWIVYRDRVKCGKRGTGRALLSLVRKACTTTPAK